MRQNILSHIMELNIADLLIRADKRTVQKEEQLIESNNLEELWQIRSKTCFFSRSR